MIQTLYAHMNKQKKLVGVFNYYRPFGVINLCLANKLPSADGASDL
jgi:hypothetical protein